MSITQILRCKTYMKKKTYFFDALLLRPMPLITANLHHLGDRVLLFLVERRDALERHAVEIQVVPVLV